MAVRTDDVFVNTPGGRLFARIWGGQEQLRAIPPIILFHDSLGLSNCGVISPPG